MMPAPVGLSVVGRPVSFRIERPQHHPMCPTMISALVLSLGSESLQKSWSARAPMLVNLSKTGIITSQREAATSDAGFNRVAIQAASHGIDRKNFARRRRKGKSSPASTLLIRVSPPAATSVGGFRVVLRRSHREKHFLPTTHRKKDLFSPLPALAVWGKKPVLGFETVGSHSCCKSLTATKLQFELSTTPWCLACPQKWCPTSRLKYGRVLAGGSGASDAASERKNV